MAAGSLTLGGNMSLAVGPLGRNGEASTALSTNGKVAAMFVPYRPCPSEILYRHHFRYSYSKTRGLFGGLSVEGSVIVERQDANAQAYHSDVSAKQILSGSVTPPEWAQSLIHTLEARTGTPGGRAWVQDGRPSPDSQYAFGGISNSNAEVPQTSRKQQRKTRNADSFPPDSWGTPKNTGSYFDPPAEEAVSGSVWDYDQAPRIDDSPLLRPVLKATLFPPYAHMCGTPPVNLSIFLLVVVPAQARNLHMPGLQAVLQAPRIRSTRKQSATAMAMTSQPHSDQRSRTRRIRSGQDLGVWKRLLHVAARPSVSTF
jgi:hypothetical protein